MIDHRTLLGGILSALATPLAAEAQQTGRVYRARVYVPFAPAGITW